jgi:hypothetical protein
MKKENTKTEQQNNFKWIPFFVMFLVIFLAIL